MKFLIVWVWRWQSGIVSVIVDCSGCTYWCTVQYGTSAGPTTYPTWTSTKLHFLAFQTKPHLHCISGSLLFIFGKIRIRKFLPNPNNYILMATSMKCDNILIMNNSNNCFGFNTPPGSQNYNNLWNFLSSDRQTYNYVHNFGHINNEINTVPNLSL